MTRPNLVTLLTDFGLDDPYVGVVKAILFQHCPAARIVDLSHTLGPYDRRAAAFWVERVFPYFPPETVHLVVVDPGVGSTRKAVAIRAHGQYFLGPDNGVLSGVFERDALAEARQLASSGHGLTPLSRTFHGRDVFAPFGAQLAAGSLGFDEVGSVVSGLCPRLLMPAVESESGSVGEVVTVDRFGNALTNLEPPGALGSFEAHVLGYRLPVVATYSDGEIGQLLALFGSFGTLELAVREGSAAGTIGLRPGTPVELRRVG